MNKMQKIEAFSDNCEELEVIQSNLTNPGKGGRRTFKYSLNEKRAKGKLLKGAKRAIHLNVEIKTGCANMRFSDGSFHEVVLPLLREWHTKLKDSIKINGFDLKIEEVHNGTEKTNKHMDTKLVVIVNDDRLVLHAYNGTQNLMVQGRNFENLAVNCLEPYFQSEINRKVQKN